MRDDLVTPATARRLQGAGLGWQPRIGDWCAVLGAAYSGERGAGLWLVVGVARAGTEVGLVDAAGRWSAAQVVARDCLWLPTVGQLKTWLRAQGYTVATGEAPGHLLGPGPAAMRFVCRATRGGVAAMPIETEGLSEAEAVAGALLAALEG